MTAYLINARDEQAVDTVEFGRIECFAYSHPAWYAGKLMMGAAFANIAPTDTLIICQGGKLRSLVVVEEVIQATDAGTDPRFVGKPVRVIQGRAVKRLGDVSVEAACRRAHVHGVAVPGLINSKLTGFKQGAFCCPLSRQQEAEFGNWP